MDTMKYYDQLRAVPVEAIKTIQAGRLKGMSDINPMWRIKVMTQAFGVCGIGWKYEVTSQWQETYGQETKCFTNVNLYVKVDGEWSDAIPGTGGATLVEANSRGTYVNDEGYKMSLTDALSVAMKALGVAADVYFAKDNTKYTNGNGGGNANTNGTDAQSSAQQQVSTTTSGQQQLTDEITTTVTDTIKAQIAACTNFDELMVLYRYYVKLQSNSNFLAMLTNRKKEVAA